MKVDNDFSRRRIPTGNSRAVIMPLPVPNRREFRSASPQYAKLAILAGNSVRFSKLMKNLIKINCHLAMKRNLTARAIVKVDFIAFSGVPVKIIYRIVTKA